MGTICSLRLGHQKKSFLGFRFADPEPIAYVEASHDTPEVEAYVQAATPHETPVDLPTAGYETFAEDTTFADEAEEDLSVLENQAHAQRVLLSSDAMRYFVGKAASVEDRTSLLDTIIAKARATFPSEDGWIVINLVRMEQLLEEVDRTDDDSVSDTEVSLPQEPKPTRSGSLAEAIVTGNVIAALELASSRPMVALADAASDLDALYRLRNGEEVAVSDLMKTESLNLSLPQIQGAINALTSAIDGTYTDEVSAVRIAIMKAIKELTS